MVVDDNPFFVRCLKRLIESEPDMMVCEQTDSSRQLLTLLRRAKPDLIVMDVMLGSENGLRIAGQLRDQGVTTPLLFISALAEPSREVLRQIGHCAFSRKGEIAANLLRTARRGLAAYR
jgi:two-component system response regulator AdeR